MTGIVKKILFKAAMKWNKSAEKFLYRNYNPPIRRIPKVKAAAK